MAGYFPPDVPTMESFPTFPRRRRSNIVNPTTPTFLSEPEAPPPTNPVVYSPVPTIKTSSGWGPLSDLPNRWLATEAMLQLKIVMRALDLVLAALGAEDQSSMNRNKHQNKKEYRYKTELQQPAMRRSRHARRVQGTTHGC